MTRSKENKEKWRRYVREHEASGLTQTTFCKERHLSLNSFSYHRAQYLAEMKESVPPTPSFVEVHFPPMTLEPFLLNLPNGMRLSLPQQFDEKRLTQLLEVLRLC